MPHHELYSKVYKSTGQSKSVRRHKTPSDDPTWGSKSHRTKGQEGDSGRGSGELRSRRVETITSLNSGTIEGSTNLCLSSRQMHAGSLGTRDNRVWDVGSLQDGMHGTGGRIATKLDLHSRSIGRPRKDKVSACTDNFIFNYKIWKHSPVLTDSSLQKTMRFYY